MCSALHVYNSCVHVLNAYEIIFFSEYNTEKPARFPFTAKFISQFQNESMIKWLNYYLLFSGSIDLMEVFNMTFFLFSFFFQPSNKWMFKVSTWNTNFFLNSVKCIQRKRLYRTRESAIQIHLETMAPVWGGLIIKYSNFRLQ